MVGKFYIFGAGISGLTTAYELSRKKRQVIVLEKESVPGGLARSFDWHGLSCDLGAHIYHTPDNEIINYWRKEFPGLLIEREHWSKNYKNGKLYDYPVSFQMIKGFPEDKREAILKELKKSGDIKKHAENYYEYIRELVGPTLQEMFYVKYPEKLWGIPTSELDANWAPKRIEIREKSTPFYWHQYCAVGADGSGSIVNSLCKKINNFHGNLRFNEKITKIECKQGRIIKFNTTKGKYQVNPEDIIINTIPATDFSSMLGYKSKLAYRGIILVYILVNKTSFLPPSTDFIYFDDPNIIFHRMVEQSRFVKSYPFGKNVCMLEISYSQGDEKDMADERKIRDRAVADFLRLGFVKPADIKDTKLIKLPKVYPMLYKGYRDEVARVKSFVDNISNLYNIGSLAEYAYSDLQVLFSKAIDLAYLLTDKTLQINRLTKMIPRLSFKREINVGGSTIGQDLPAYLIAEVGLNHNGSLELAKKLVDNAVEAGVNAVKIQTYITKNRVASKGRTSRYAEKILGIEETDYEMLKKYELSFKETAELFHYAAGKIDIFSTPFDVESVAILEKLKVHAYKVASFDLNNFLLLREIAKTGKPIILSTGMSSLAEIEEALNEIIPYNDQVVLLHCVSSYPSQAESMNIRVIDTLKTAFKLPVGLSDHSLGYSIALAAVARGANVIEKHLTTNREMEGPDHAVSLQPQELREMVYQMRLIEVSLGDGIKRQLPAEFSTMLRFKKTLYAARKIKKGQMIKRENILLKGPAFGISPRFIEIVIGRRAKDDIEADNPITWKYLE